MITQRDSQTTIKISASSATTANLTRRDSAAMKVIAGLTMVFLPGTSVAAFFSMVFFRAGEGGGKLSVDESIWLYAAVAIPLTVLTVAVWAGWLWYKLGNDKQRKEP